VNGYFTAVCGLAALGILLQSGLRHAFQPARFTRALFAQETLPPLAVWPAAILVTLAEVGIGVSGLVVAMSVPNSSFLRTALFLAALTYIVYAAYAGLLLRRAPGAPCGCSGEEAPVNGWIIGRSLVLAGMASVALATSPSGAIDSASGIEVLVFIASAVGIGTIVWQLPMAMSGPLAGELP
jgi:hypothetical protein